MRRISRRSFIATNIRLEFEEGPVFLAISRGATLAQVSETLDMIAKCHGGEPVAIDVLFKHRQRMRGRHYPYSAANSDSANLNLQ